MPDTLEPIQSFWSTQEAYLARNRLEAEGIRSYLSDEAVTGLVLYTVGIGGIKLLVNQADAERAARILDEDVEPASLDDATDSAAEDENETVHASAEESEEDDPSEENEQNVLKSLRGARSLIWLFVVGPLAVGLFFDSVKLLWMLKDSVGELWFPGS